MAWTDELSPADSGTLVSALLSRIYPRLHATSATDAVWWTDAELIAWLNRALARLCGTAGVHVKRSSDSTANATAVYALPTDHASLIRAAIGNSALRPASVAELTALDNAFESTAGTPTRWYADQIGQASIGLHPVPDAVLTLSVIHHAVLSVSVTGDTVKLPSALMPYLETAVLADAYGKESDAQMPETQEVLSSWADTLESVAKAYWGRSR